METMPAMDRLPYLAAILLLAATQVAAAETPLPDPIAPAVVGRPLEQIRPARPVRPKAAAAKPNRPKPVAVANKAANRLSDATATVVAPPLAQAAATPPAATSPAAAQPEPGTPRPAKQELDSANTQARVEDNVGQGPVQGTQRTAPGIFFGSKEQAVIRRYYATHPAPGKGSKWIIGDPVPPRTTMTGVPDEVRAALPPVPPGHQYVQVDDEVVLVAVPSRMVVDGVSRAVR